MHPHKSPARADLPCSMDRVDRSDVDLCAFWRMTMSKTLLLGLMLMLMSVQLPISLQAYSNKLMVNAHIKMFSDASVQNKQQMLWLLLFDDLILKWWGANVNTFNWHCINKNISKSNKREIMTAKRCLSTLLNAHKKCERLNIKHENLRWIEVASRMLGQSC